MHFFVLLGILTKLFSLSITNNQTSLWVCVVQMKYICRAWLHLFVLLLFHQELRYCHATYANTNGITIEFWVQWKQKRAQNGTHTRIHQNQIKWTQSVQ